MLLISRLECVIAGQAQTIRLTPGTLTARGYGRGEAVEEFRCGFGLNPRYREKILSKPLRIAGVDKTGEVRAVELGNHPFFVATLFLPQLSSTPAAPHPLLVAFLRAAGAFHGVRSVGL
jgi:CTP synthase (UTP-ammonia lyase)